MTTAMVDQCKRMHLQVKHIKRFGKIGKMVIKITMEINDSAEDKQCFREKQ